MIKNKVSTNNYIKRKKLKPFQWKLKKRNADLIEQLKKSILEDGFLAPIFIWQDNWWYILDWHQRLKALNELAKKKEMLENDDVPVVYIQAETEQEAWNNIFAYNSHYSEVEWTIVAKLYADKQLDKINSQTKNIHWIDLDKLMTDKEIVVCDEQAEKEHAYVEDGEIIYVQPWDIFKLWNHILKCWSATSTNDVNELLDYLQKDEKIRLIFSSPPYNMKGDMYREYDDDLKSEEFIEFNLKTIELAKPKLKWSVFWNISYNKNSRWEFLQIASDLRNVLWLEFLDHIIWNKKKATSITLYTMLTRQAEEVFVYWNDKDNIKIKAWFEDNWQTFTYTNDREFVYNKRTTQIFGNYWELMTDGTQSEWHGAWYPLELPQKWIELATLKDDIVYDPFMWTWTTLIACEKTSRKSLWMELMPKYVQNILKRYNKYTRGEKTIECLNNKDFDFSFLNK